MVKLKIKEMTVDELQDEVSAARQLLTDARKHLEDAVPFYGYMANVEELCKENYELQRRMQVFIEDPPREILIKWLGDLTELLRQHRGIRPGQDLAVDNVALFLGYDQWVKQDKERLGG